MTKEIKMTPKLIDIANHVNVSVSTVSRVLNGRDRVSDKTREKVLSAIEKFDYKPNEIARSLRIKTSMTIGLVFPDISNEFFSMVGKGAESVARKNGYLVIVCNTNNDREIEEEYVNMLKQKQVDAIVLATVNKDKGYFERILNDNVPVVFVDNLPRLKNNYNSVTIDNVKAAFDLTGYLISRGHRQIGAIMGSMEETSAAERLEGFKRALGDGWEKVFKDYVRIGEFTYESGYGNMTDLLNLPVIPDGIFAANNMIAYGAIRAIRDRGLSVPEDIEVVCFDADDKTGLLSIKIPSVIQPAQLIGRTALDIIMKQLEGGEGFEKIILEPVFEI